MFFKRLLSCCIFPAKKLWGTLTYLRPVAQFRATPLPDLQLGFQRVDRFKSIQTVTNESVSFSLMCFSCSWQPKSERVARAGRMEPRRGAVVQRGGSIQHFDPCVLPRPQASFPTVPGFALPPAGALRLLPSIVRLHHHPRESCCFTPAVYQVSCT